MRVFVAQIRVTRRHGILDPQGEAVKKGLASLGFQHVDDVRVDKWIRVRFRATDADAARAAVEEMCSRLLANPVIEDYDFEVSAVERV